GAVVGTRTGAVDHLFMANNQLGTGFTYVWPGTPGGWYGFRGSIVEARFWNTARTQAQVQDDGAALLTGREPGLLAYYPLDEAAGNPLDLSPQQGDGILEAGLGRTAGSGPTYTFL